MEDDACRTGSCNIRYNVNVQSSNMLFEMNPLSIVFMVLATLFIFSGVILIIMGLAAMASF